MTGNPADAKLRPAEELARSLGLSAMLLTGVILVARPLLSGYDGPSLGSSTAQLVAILLAAVATGRALIAGRLSMTRTPMVAATAVMLIVIAVTTMMAPHTAPGMDVLETWIVYGLVLLAVFATARGERGARFIVSAVIATAAVAAAYGIFQRYFGLAWLRAGVDADPDRYRGFTQAFGAARRLRSNRVFGTFVLPNTLAGYIALVLPVTLACLAGAWRERRPRLRIIALAIAAAMLCWCLVLTGSRGGLAAAIAGVGLLALIKLPGPWQRRPRLAAVVIVVAGVVLAAALLSVPETVPLLGAARKSLAVRVDYWRAALSMIWHEPFGVGPGAFADNYPLYKVATGWEARHPHSIYLNWAAEAGLFGLAAFIYWLAAAARSVPRPLTGAPASCGAAPVDDKAEGKLRAVGMIAGVLAFVILYIGPGAMGSNSLWSLALGGESKDFGKTVTEAAVHLAFVPLWCVVFAGAFLRPLPRGWWPAGLAGGLAAFLVHGLVDVDDKVPGIVMTVLALAAAGWITREADGTAERDAVPLVGRHRMAAAVLAAAVLAGLVAMSFYPRIRGVIALEASEGVARGGESGDLEEIGSELEGASRLRAWDDKLHYRLYVLLSREELQRPGRRSVNPEATERIRICAELNPRSHAYSEQLGHRLFSLGQYDDATKQYELSSRRYPLRPMGLIYLGDARLLSGDAPGAFGAWTSALEADRKVTDERTLLASVPLNAYFSTWRRERAETALRAELLRRMKMDPPESEKRILSMRIGLLWTAYSNSRPVTARARVFATAARDMEKGIPGLRSDPQALLLLGAIYLKAGNRARTSDCWAAASQVPTPLAPGGTMHPEVLRRYADKAATMRAAPKARD